MFASTCSSLRVLSSRSFSRQQAARFFSTFKVAIVGSGPSGCYTAKYLKSALPDCRIDIVERLPTPYGLVRYGVAPDHPAVKNVQNDFDAVLQDNHFYANVNVGSDETSISLDDLRKRYHATVLAYGCDDDRGLSIENSALTLSAREFVAWYNGHPDFQHLTLPSNIRKAVIVGQGNVAIDCARILSKSKEELFDTDICQHALDSSIGDSVPHVTIVGRRGPVQGAFTIKELRELTQLPGTKFVVKAEEVNNLNSASEQELQQARPKQRILKLLQKVAAGNSNGAQDDDSDIKKEIHLRFNLSPYTVNANAEDGSIEALVCEYTELQGEAGAQKAVGTGEFETLPADLVLVSIGYKGRPISGLEGFFDESRGVVRNEHGKIDCAGDGKGGLYASGWLKRGPSGIIGTNIPDAKDTVASIVHDLKDGDDVSPERVDDGIEELLEERGVEYVTWEGFQRLDAEEKANKRTEGQPREKIVDLKLQLEATRSTE